METAGSPRQSNC